MITTTDTIIRVVIKAMEAAVEAEEMEDSSELEEDRQALEGGEEGEALLIHTLYITSCPVTSRL